MSIQSIARTGWAGIALAALCLLGAPAVAHAAPNCGQVPAPPACGGAPTPQPTPPLGNYTSEWFSPNWSEPNYFNVIVRGVPTSAVAGLSDGQVTRFHASISCTNGIYISSPLSFLDAATPTLIYGAQVDPGVAPGSCLATVWDKSTLRVAGAAVSSTRGTGGNSWAVVFD